MRKAVGVLVAVLALAGGGLASRRADLTRVRTARLAAESAADAAAQRATQTISAIALDLKLKAVSAGANPRLVFALQGNADERTMRDLWRTEEWWRPWRTEFKIYAVSVSGLHLDAIEGIDAADLDAAPLLTLVRDRGEAAGGIVVAKGRPYAAAATTVKVPGRDQGPVLILAKPVDRPMLRKLTEMTGSAVVITDGHSALIDAGPEAERALLTGAIGSESTSPLFHGTNAPWAAAARALAPGLWLWTYASAAAAAHEADLASTQRKLASWGVAVLVAGLGLALGLKRKRPAAPDSTQGAASPRSAAAGGTSASPSASAAPSPNAGSGSAPHATDARGRPVPGAGAGTNSHPGATTPPSEGTFGRYTLLDRLGEGGMAEVYTAVAYGAEGFRRKFVIKRLRAELARDQAAVDQFIDEANLASSMVHSNIVPVFDFGKVGEEYFLAQEYILGRDLARVTRRSVEQDGHPVPAPVTLYAAHETLKALEYAHTKISETGQALEIVHRDVSPTNVIISARGEVKLFDFGIVKAEGRVTKTQSGVVKGNVTFMSPEQARGTTVDARADLFSLGLVLYYCLTGQVLYSGTTTYELLVKAATGPGPDEFNLLRALPEPYGPLLYRALQVKPTDRFQSAREFGDAFEEHIRAGAADLAALMNRLFADDFKLEEARFRAFAQTGQSSPGAAAHDPLPRRG